MSIEVGGCTACRRSFHPVPRRCPGCGSGVVAREHPGHGMVLSWTRVERPPAGFDAPQRVLLVQLTPDVDEQVGPLALAAAGDDALLRSGLRVRLEPQGVRLRALRAD